MNCHVTRLARRCHTVLLVVVALTAAACGADGGQIATTPGTAPGPTWFCGEFADVEPIEPADLIPLLDAVQAWMWFDDEQPVPVGESDKIDTYSASSATRVVAGPAGNDPSEDNPETVQVGEYFRLSVLPEAARQDVSVAVAVGQYGQGAFVWVGGARDGFPYGACGAWDTVLAALDAFGPELDPSVSLGVLFGTLDDGTDGVTRKEVIQRISAPADSEPIESWDDIDPSRRVLSDAPDEFAAALSYANVDVTVPSSWESSDVLLCTRTPDGWGDCTTMAATDRGGRISLDVSYRPGQVVEVVFKDAPTVDASSVIVATLAAAELGGNLDIELNSPDSPKRILSFGNEIDLRTD
jgi:hypothetical protein